MRVLKLIVAGLFAAVAVAVAVFAGAIAAAVVAAIGLAVYLSRRLLGRPPATRVVNAPRPRPASNGDAIEITATEVATGPASDGSSGTRALPPDAGAQHH
ncbi:hypothetical protein [Opitutus terrae]|uniref:Uncharacterized protein n=1 Tax=Opitutus terrae (strain DSM 11246 / JCM 15787 / PB90-1) TaxID=452637 RepID=B1ZQR1_OPITP|nr:hypothetical protein [Opitutus terrae]ACB77812.1 hypothetical protein Oter_4541 [Opitutus terrae PB90-1]